MTEFIIQKGGQYYSAYAVGCWAEFESHAMRFASYIDACRLIANNQYAWESSRIIEAPPKRLTDEECWAWMKAHRAAYLMYSLGDAQWFVGGLVVSVYADTPLDAIRAAAAKCSR